MYPVKVMPKRPNNWAAKVPAATRAAVRALARSRTFRCPCGCISTRRPNPRGPTGSGDPKASRNDPSNIPILIFDGQGNGELMAPSADPGNDRPGPVRFACGDPTETLLALPEFPVDGGYRPLPRGTLKDGQMAGPCDSPAGASATRPFSHLPSCRMIRVMRW